MTCKKASELYNELLKMYFDEHVHFSFSKTRKLGPKYDAKSLFLNGYYHDVWYEE